jgi:uncharacterized protein YecT (DUF1311 family)
MKTTLAIILSLILALGSTPRTANSGEWPETYDQCLKRRPSTQNEINSCADLEFGAADKRLNALYGEILALEPHKPELRDMQRKWVAFRDASCTYEVAHSGGSMSIGERWRCMTRVTEAQINVLKVYLAVLKENAEQ